MNDQPQTVCYDEDEIDLRELFTTIARYKKFIIVFTLLVTLLAAAYAFLKKPVYEIQADIQVGYISGSNSNAKLYMIEPYALKIYIKNNFDNSDDPDKTLPKVTVDLMKKSKDILNLSIEDISNEAAKKYLDTIMSAVKTEEDKKLLAYTQNIQDQINILQEQKKRIEEQIPLIYKELRRIKDSFIYQTLLTNIQKMNNDVLNIKLRIQSLEEKISPLNLTRTSFIGNVKQHDHPIKPKKKLIIVVAFITGLILAIFLVFFIEFIKSMKEEEDAAQAKE